MDWNCKHNALAWVIIRIEKFSHRYIPLIFFDPRVPLPRPPATVKVVLSLIRLTDWSDKIVGGDRSSASAMCSRGRGFGGPVGR